MIELETKVEFNDITLLKENETYEEAVAQGKLLRKIGDKFKVDEERARYLIDTRGLCIVVSIDKQIEKEVNHDNELAVLHKDGVVPKVILEEKKQGAKSIKKKRNE